MRPNESGGLRLPRRAILIYLLTIVLPVGVLLWFGIGSFDRQREAIAALTAEKLATQLEVRTREAAAAAFEDRTHPIAAHFFIYQDGELVRPACARRCRAGPES